MGGGCFLVLARLCWARGPPIGSGKPFALSGTVAEYYDGVQKYGPWNGKEGYLGFKFPSNGKNDFGWAKMSCSPYGTCHITEFAYDTVPGQTIEAGQTSAIPEPGTLSLLALGAAGLAVLRKRKRSAVSRQQPQAREAGEYLVAHGVSHG